MKKLLTPIVLLFVLSACEKTEYFQPEYYYEIRIDSVLNRTGSKSIPIDSNGYYHLKIDNPYSKQQTHRVVGTFLIDGKEPKYPHKIDFESNLYWVLQRGDTIATIRQTYINYFTGQFTSVQLPPFMALKSEMVKTTNTASYTGKNGEFSNMIAPIKEMIGDTMILKSENTLSKKIAITKIILE